MTPATPAAPSPTTVVWVEILVRHLDAAVDFYTRIFQYPMVRVTEDNQEMVFFAEGISGHLRLGTPAAKGAGSVIHLNVPDTLEAAMARCVAAGGEIASPVVTIPQGRFAYAHDLDGNTIGLFQANRG